MFNGCYTCLRKKSRWRLQFIKHEYYCLYSPTFFLPLEFKFPPGRQPSTSQNCRTDDQAVSISEKLVFKTDTRCWVFQICSMVNWLPLAPGLNIKSLISEAVDFLLTNHKINHNLTHSHKSLRFKQRNSYSTVVFDVLIWIWFCH